MCFNARSNTLSSINHPSPVSRLSGITWHFHQPVCVRLGGDIGVVFHAKRLRWPQMKRLRIYSPGALPASGRDLRECQRFHVDVRAKIKLIKKSPHKHRSVSCWIQLILLTPFARLIPLIPNHHVKQMSFLPSYGVENRLKVFRTVHYPNEIIEPKKSIYDSGHRQQPCRVHAPWCKTPQRYQKVEANSLIKWRRGISISLKSDPRYSVRLHSVRKK